jgi:hypothetical protein
MLLKENSKRIDKTKRYKVYIFDCIKCKSKEIRLQAGSLKTHSGKCRSCVQQGEDYAHIYNELKNHRNKKVNFNLTFEEFLSIIKNAKCHYCEEELIYNKHAKEWGKSLTRAHQLDRKDNSKGYSIDNVVCCCWTCNRLKSDAFTYDEFILFSEILKQIKLKRKQNGK